MMTHTEARTFASARADGELDGSIAQALEQHLGACADCRRFSDRLPELSALITSMPYEPAPVGLADAVGARISRPRATTHLPVRRRLVTAFSAAAAVALVVVGLPAPGFQVPAAGAAEPLTRITSLEIVRDVTVTAAGTAHTAREHIWYRAPGLVRIERSAVEGPLDAPALEIRKPGERYSRFPDGTQERRTGTAPSAGELLPEPLTPVGALAGAEAGPGPVIAGHRTVRYVIETSGGTQEVFVDPRFFTALGGEEQIVLGKNTIVLGKETAVESGRVHKRVVSVRYNHPVPDRLFAIPGGIAAVGEGYVASPVARIPGAPATGPRGYSLAGSVRRGAGGVILYTRGAFPIEIRTGDEVPGGEGIERRKNVRVGPFGGVYVAELYQLPRVEFFSGGVKVSIAAPLAGEALVRLVALFYPE